MLTPEQRAGALHLGRKILAGLSDDEVLELAWPRILGAALAAAEAFRSGVTGRMAEAALEANQQRLEEVGDFYTGASVADGR